MSIDPFDVLREALPAGISLQRRPSALGAMLDETYPDGTRLTLDGRIDHSDIPLLADEEIDRERVLCVLRWALTHRPSAWLIQRRARLDAEAERRQNAKGRR